ncbi:MAG: hypothetical protein ACP5I3_03340 [Thermoproteus sp.]
MPKLLVITIVVLAIALVVAYKSDLVAWIGGISAGGAQTATGRNGINIGAALAGPGASGNGPQIGRGEPDADVLAVATLPPEFTVVGPYARLLYDRLGLPEGSALNASALNYSYVRLAWHVDRLTLVMPNGTSIAVEARTEVIQVEAGGFWVTIPPASVRPGYEITIVRGNNTLAALMEVAKNLLKQMLHRPQPPWPHEINTANFTLIKARVIVFRWPTKIPPPAYVPYMPPPQSWSAPNITTNRTGNSTKNPTWALSTFAKINSSNAVCGYIFPLNGSDLVVPISDYVGVPLTIFQDFENNGRIVGFLMPQVVAQLWPPALVENVWASGIGEPLSVASTSLTSPVDWLASGVALCISQLDSGNGNYQITLTAAVNGNNYTIATIYENPVAGVYNISISLGPGVQGFANPVTAVNARPMPFSVSFPYNASSIFYPSIAFETNDTSSSFFGNNTGFALDFQMGDSPYDVGEWPLYYSISEDLPTCQNVWGTSDVGNTWPPANTVWGASGSTVLYYYGSSHDGAVGSTSLLWSKGYANVVGISCNYVDTDLSSLNVLKGIT